MSNNDNKNVHLCECSSCGYTAYVLKTGHHDCDECLKVNTMKETK